jgi:hypothetical protein
MLTLLFALSLVTPSHTCTQKIIHRTRNENQNENQNQNWKGNGNQNQNEFARKKLGEKERLSPLFSLSPITLHHYV